MFRTLRGLEKQLRGGVLPDVEVARILQRAAPLLREAVAVALRPRTPHRGALRAVEHAELHGREVGNAAHLTAECIYFSDYLSFLATPPTAGLQDMEASFSMSIVSSSVRLPRRAAAEAASASGVSSADDDDVVFECHFLISVLVRCRGVCGFSAMTCRADRAVRCGVFRPGVRVRAGGVPRPPGFLRRVCVQCLFTPRLRACAAMPSPPGRGIVPCVGSGLPRSFDHQARVLVLLSVHPRWRGASCLLDRRGAARRAPPRGASPGGAGRRRAGRVVGHGLHVDEHVASRRCPSPFGRCESNVMTSVK